MRECVRLGSVLLLAVLLTACGDSGNGGTGDGGGGGGGGNAPTYTVGGTMTGLKGSGLQLSSGLLTLTISTDGPFTFPTGLTSGSAYGVTVVTQPSSPAQVCTVAGGSGTIATSNVTSVAVTCTTPTPPVITHTVGGVVSSLSGSGLKLNDGTEDLAITADGAFTFPTALDEGAQYNVTVVTQPNSPVQVCAVSQGSGTVGTSNVTAVVVTCTTPDGGGGGGGAATYSIGGTISGLTGSALSGAQVTLVNGAGEGLSIGANGAFTFPTALASGTQYHVTVATQPTTPNQVCTVSSGDGTVGTDNVTNITVACQTSPLTFVSTPATGAVGVLRTVIPTLTFSAAVAPNSVTTNSITLTSATGATPITLSMQGAQKVVVTPTRTLLPNTPYTLTVKRPVSGSHGEELAANATVTFTTTAGTWGDATPIESSDDGATAPRIATDGQGNAIAVWSKITGVVFNVYANRFTPTEGWGTPVAIQTDASPNFPAQQIAIDKSGNAVAVWLRKNSAGINEVWANHYVPNGGGWGTAAMISAVGSSNDSLIPQIAMTANGDATAVWVQSAKIMSARYRAAGDVWDSSGPISSSTGTAIDSGLQIACDANANTMVVWSANEGGDLRVWSKYNSNVPEVIDSSATTDGLSPQVAFDPNGTAVAVWVQSRGLSLDIRSNRYVPGRGWGMSVRIDNEDGDRPPSPTLAVDAAGNVIAVWQRIDGMRANRYTPNDNWGTVPAMIGADPFGASGTVAPRIAIDTKGNALVVWEMRDGQHSNIWSNGYTAPADGGTGWGAARLIEHDDTGDAFVPDVAINTLGQGLAVWQQSDNARYIIQSSVFQ